MWKYTFGKLSTYVSVSHFKDTIIPITDRISASIAFRYSDTLYLIALHTLLPSLTSPAFPPLITTTHVIPHSKNFVVLSWLRMYIHSFHLYHTVYQIEGKRKTIEKNPFRGKIVGTMKPIYFCISVPSCIPFVEINF